MNIVGDKGYKLNQDVLARLRTKHVHMHVPQRKNQRQATTDRTKQFLKTRYKVENVFQQLKTFGRINVRCDKKLINYFSFLYIALIKKFV